MKKSNLYLIGILILLMIPLISVGLIHLSRFIITPNDSFFELSIGEIPEIEKDDWTLSIWGEVENEIVFDYNNFTSLKTKSLIATLECVEGPFGTAWWVGIPLINILEIAGIGDNAKDVVFFAADDYSDSLNLKEASANNILLAFKMNHVELPKEHGFPVRLVCPDHYGYKWVKWIVGIEIVDYDYIGFWEARGWSDNAMRTNFTAWITHAYLFTFTFIFAGLSFISGYKMSSRQPKFQKLSKFVNKRFHIVTSLLFVLLSSVSFIYWIIITILTRGAVFYSFHGIIALITIGSITLGAILGLRQISQKKRTQKLHGKVSKFAFYLYLISIIFGLSIALLGSLRLNQIFTFFF